MTQINRYQRKQARRPIGVFDSGLGGLTIVREIRKSLPTESVIYFGDLARLPYGIKSKQQIIKFSLENARLLQKHDVKAIVVACNSSSSVAIPSLTRKFRKPIIDVISPAAKTAIKKSSRKRIGIIATQATVESQAYENAIKKIDSSAKIWTQACPLFVPFVEEGRLSGPILRNVIKEYLKPLLLRKIDTLILGCTHYPLIKSAIKKVVGKKVRLVDSMAPTVNQLVDRLDQDGLLSQTRKKGQLMIQVSDKSRNFVKVGEKFLGEKIKKVKIIK